MIAEVLLVLAGHSSSLFPTDHTVHPSFVPLLHPGEQQCLESLGQIAVRYRKIKQASLSLTRSPSRYISALCATLNQILKDEYENLVVETEAKILTRDSTLVGSGSFVPLSSIRATFAEWDAPLVALETLVGELQSPKAAWQPGPLIDMLLSRSYTGIHRIASIYTRLSEAVQRVWLAQLQAFMIHGTRSSSEPLASEDYVLLEGSMPRCVSSQTRESIAYVGRAIGTVKSAKWEKQYPRMTALEHTRLLDSVLPQDQYDFDRVVGDIRTAVSEWLWLNVLTHKDVDDAVESLANYFLLRNGEFALSLIREVERLKISRLTARKAPSSVIREQDLQLALLRASLGTSAQHDASLANLRFHMPSGPLRPLLPSLAPTQPRKDISSTSIYIPTEQTTFDDLLLGTPLNLSYTVSWPLNLFLHNSDLQAYGLLFSYLSALRKTHTRIHTCWTSLSNSQRMRRKWTGLDEGGTAEEGRKELLRCGWGVVRTMSWFLDTLLGYMMTDVVEVEFRRLKELLLNKVPGSLPRQLTGAQSQSDVASGEPTPSASAATMPPSYTANTVASMVSTVSTASTRLDFSTLRSIHTTYLERLLTGSLLSNGAVTPILRQILEVCERFVAQVERWGGDILPALLFEGTLGAEGGSSGVGEMVKERQEVVGEIDDSLHILLESFYEQLSLSTTYQPFAGGADASKSMLHNITATNASLAFHTTTKTFIKSKRNGKGSEEEVRRHVERLLLRLDFNGEFSTHRVGRRTRQGQGGDGGGDGEEILKEGGLA